MGGRRVVPWVLLLPLLGALAPQQARGQTGGEGGDPLRPSWMFRVGVARQGLSDRLASPLRHRGTGLLLDAGYGAPGHGGGWAVDAAYWAPRIDSRLASDLGGFEETHQVDLRFVWLRPVTEVAGGRIGLHLGGALDARFSFRTHHYVAWGWEAKRERFGDLFVPLQLAGMWSAPLGERGLLTHRVAVPALTLAFRSPYTGLKYFPDASLEGPTSVTGFDSRLAVRTRTDSGWMWGLFHHMTVVRYPAPRQLSSVVHRIGVEVAR